MVEDTGTGPSEAPRPVKRPYKRKWQPTPRYPKDKYGVSETSPTSNRHERRRAKHERKGK